MNRMGMFLGAAALGALAMYVLDPRGGRRRRALVRDKIVRAAHETGDAVEVTARDVVNRARGSVAEMRSWVARRPPSDAVLAERVRAKLGFLVSHPRSIDVAVESGRVLLRGPVLADEVDQLLGGVAAVRGVAAVENRLEVHREPGNVPGLQGEPRPRRGATVFPLMQTVWSPTARLVAGVVGTAVALAGLRRGMLGTPLALGGALLVARGATNLEVKRLVGIGAGRRAVDVRKAIEIAAPVDVVFEFWSHYENFARFMSNVREVRRSGTGRAHWVVAGPDGAPVEFDTEETRRQPNRVLAWKTVPGSLVEHAGSVRFEPTRDGGTRVQVQMSYNPPAGAVGHAVAALLGGDPRRVMDEDLVRLKSLLEEGKTTANGTTVSRERMGEAAR